ncbi:MAG: YcjF family protein [Eggerthellaceae bacterium]|jgi:uncharacterized protein (DUF697 family)
MKSPVDVKAVLDAVSDTEEARSKEIRVHLYVDDTAPDDLVNLIAAAFRTSAPNASVIVDGYPNDGRMPDALADMAVLVAGKSKDTGMLVADLRSLNTPSLVVTTSPVEVTRIAVESKYPLMEQDLISPHLDSDGLDAIPESTADGTYRLTATSAADLCTDIGEWIVDVFPEKRLAFANAFGFVRRPLSLESVRATSVQNAGIGLVVILPGADMPLMTLNQLKMLLQIAAAYGQPLTLSRAKEMLAVIGGGFGCRAAARQLVSMFPGIGWAIKAGIGYCGTAAMGRALVEYFEADADVVQLAGKAADASTHIAPAFGVSSDATIQENAANVVSHLKTQAVGKAQQMGKQAIPFAQSVVAAAADATGLTSQDIADVAKMAVNAAGDRVSRIRPGMSAK